MSDRDRSEGWTHAKLSGHALEDALAARLQSDKAFSSKLHLACFGTPDNSLPKVEGGGITAAHVPCVFGGVTPTKTDLRVRWDSGKTARISVKKSYGGQVWLVTPVRFIEGFKAQYGVEIPDRVKQGIRFFIGPLSESEIQTLLNGRPPMGPKRSGVHQELHQDRFVSATLDAYFPEIWRETLVWMRANLPKVAELCFSRGLCSDPNDYAEFVWYYVVNEDTDGLETSRVIPISQIIGAINAMSAERRVVVGPRNGGSTLLLPFGFLQMHRPAGDNQVQFHHGYSALGETLGFD